MKQARPSYRKSPPLASTQILNKYIKTHTCWLETCDGGSPASLRRSTRHTFQQIYEAAAATRQEFSTDTVWNEQGGSLKV